ncbi:SAP domain-containing protein [Sulfuriflexus mobilis]|uniref:SAP domain-containing protein n=1 Tax=Sulfuriflexus mobilis TaxID=1811807 RepID=UPI0018D57F63|nr:SAP domain-containing protein [Sulfuriflexus mobilis]
MMNMQEIRSVAKDFGIKTGRMSKVQLIQTIQLNEGNFNCFASAVDGECDQSQCKWREDCFAAAKKLHS